MPRLPMGRLRDPEAAAAAMKVPLDRLFETIRTLLIEKRDYFTSASLERASVMEIAARVSESSTMFGHSIEMAAGLQDQDIAGTIHARPMLGEAVQEAALRAMGFAIHI
jgi:hypothetical protein